jgi:hypothetical protein
LQDNEYEEYLNFLNDPINLNNIEHYMYSNKFNGTYDYLYDNKIIYIDTNIKIYDSLFDRNINYDLYMIHKGRYTINEIVVIIDKEYNLQNLYKDYYAFKIGLNVIRINDIKYLKKLIKKIDLYEVPFIKYYQVDNIFSIVASEINNYSEKKNKIINYNNNKKIEKQKIQNEVRAIINEYG